MIDVLLVVLGRPPYNDSDVLQLEQSDSSSDATASCSATCTSSDTAVSDNQRLVAPAAPASTRSVSLLHISMEFSHLLPPRLKPVAQVYN